jgi:hypothetical protein
MSALSKLESAMLISGNRLTKSITAPFSIRAGRTQLGMHLRESIAKFEALLFSTLALNYSTGPC